METKPEFLITVAATLLVIYYYYVYLRTVCKEFKLTDLIPFAAIFTK